MKIMLSGPNKRKGFSNQMRKVLNEELKDCKSLVAIAVSNIKEKNEKYFNGSEDSLGAKGMFKQLNLNIEKYSLIDYRNTKEEMIDMIKESDIVYLMGGDPLIQLELIKKIDYKKLFQDKIIIGVSAGSMNMAKKSYYSKDEQCDETFFYDGLGLVDLTIDPHFDIDDEEQVKEALDNSKNQKIIGLPNESGILIKQNTIFIGKYYEIYNNGIQEKNSNV